MGDGVRTRRILIPALVLIVTLGALTSSGALSAVRSVDALLIFVAGVSAGVLLVGLFASRR
jgi:hypothetical protein